MSDNDIQWIEGSDEDSYCVKGVYNDIISFHIWEANDGKNHFCKLRINMPGMEAKLGLPAFLKSIDECKNYCKEFLNKLITK